MKWPKRKRRPRPAYDIERLRRAARMLTGWTYTGGGEWPPSADRLMSEAADEIERLHTALADIAAQQPSTLATLMSHGIVFDGPLGNDPENWQHVAFHIYTDLCRVDCIAREAIASE